MAFVDYVTLLLVNMTAGYCLLSSYVYWGLDEPLDKKWVPGFAIVGLVAIIFGAHMTATWPLPGPFNSAFGEMSVLLGFIFAAAALAIANGWSLVIVTVYAFYAGAAAVLLGVRIVNLGLTQMPALSGLGFILSGLGGVFAAPTLVWLRRNRPFRTLAAIVLGAAAVIWAIIGYLAYWGHMEGFAGWVPLAARATGAG